MRLIAVPLARVRPGAPPVTTFLAQSNRTARPVAASLSAGNNGKEGAGAGAGTGLGKGKEAERGAVGDGAGTTSTEKAASSSSSSSSAEQKLPLTSRLMNKASDFWIGLGKEDQKSTFDWKRRTYKLGERLMDKIEYEEWALKAVDPAFGPTLNPNGHSIKKEESEEKQRASENVKKVTKMQDSPVAALNVPLLFPSSVLSASSLLSSLQRLTASRQPHHRQRLIWCVVGMPFTIPFIVVPVVPNLPFFYLVWRAWSHWRAYNSSKYLSQLISQGRLVPTPSEELDRILSIPSEQATAPATAVAEESKAAPTQDGSKEKIDYERFLLLKPHTIKALAKAFDLEHQLSIELTRARQQTIEQIQRGQMDKLEQAATGHRSDEPNK